MRTLLSCFLIAACAVPTTVAFAPHSLAAKSTTRPQLKPLSAFLPEHVDALSAAADQWHHVMASSSSMLADAADVAVDASKEGGWWESYLNIFKATLIGVHSTITPPLRSIGITETWGLSIFLFTAGVRTLLVPLSYQQTKSAEYMKALKPYVAEIKEKFKNQQAQQRAIGKLYQDADQNPLAGCFVSLAQLPILLGLYRGVRLLAIDGQLNEPFLWIPSLEGPVAPPDYRGLDWLTQGWTDMDGFPTPSLGWETTLAFLVMPVILVLGQSLTMSVLTPAVGDDDSMSQEEKDNLERSQGILKFLPLMIGFFSLQVPAGLTIYWFTSNLYTLAQSLLVRQYYTVNPPVIDLPDYWDALDDVENMSPEEKRKAAEAGLSAGPTFDDLKDDAKFHYMVQRSPLRAESEAWKRVESGPLVVPTEMASWVGSSNSDAATETDVVAETEVTNVEAAKA